MLVIDSAEEDSYWQFTQEICPFVSLDQVEEAYTSIEPLHTKLDRLMGENSKFCQVCSAQFPIILSHHSCVHALSVVHT